jgi:hypothetical protein
MWLTAREDFIKVGRYKTTGCTKRRCVMIMEVPLHVQKTVSLSLSFKIGYMERLQFY